MTLKEIADSLIAHCRAHTEAEALATLYAPDAVSIEAMAMEGTESREAKGTDAIRAKHDWWYRTMEIHSDSAEGPFLHGDDQFAVIFQADASNRETGERMAMHEVGLYTVADGKIVREAFFYAM